MASPEPVKEALQVFEEKLNELEALLFEESNKKTRDFPLFVYMLFCRYLSKK